MKFLNFFNLSGQLLLGHSLPSSPDIPVPTPVAHVLENPNQKC